MAYVIVKNTVADFATWKPFFDEDSSARKAVGSRGSRLFRSVDNPNEVTVLMEWDSAENARKFSESPDLRKVMERAGVLGRPTFSFLDEVESKSQ